MAPGLRLEPPGALLGTLERLWGPLGAPGALLGRSLGLPGSAFGATWSGLRRSLEASWHPWGPKGAPGGDLGSILIDFGVDFDGFLDRISDRFGWRFVVRVALHTVARIADFGFHFAFDSTVAHMGWQQRCTTG